MAQSEVARSRKNMAMSSVAEWLDRGQDLAEEIKALDSLMNIEAPVDDPKREKPLKSTLDYIQIPLTSGVPDLDDWNFAIVLSRTTAKYCSTIVATYIDQASSRPTLPKGPNHLREDVVRPGKHKHAGTRHLFRHSLRLKLFRLGNAKRSDHLGHSSYTSRTLCTCEHMQHLGLVNIVQFSTCHDVWAKATNNLRTRSGV